MTTNPITIPTTIPTSWTIMRKYNSISTASTATINGILAVILTLVSALNTEPSTQQIISISFGSTIAILNLLIHFGLQVGVACTTQNAQQEAQEEAYINQA